MQQKRFSESRVTILAQQWPRPLNQFRSKPMESISGAIAIGSAGCSRFKEGGELQRLDVNNFTTKRAESLLHGRILRGCLTSFLFRLAFFFLRRRRLVTSGISSFNGKANAYFTTAE